MSTKLKYSILMALAAIGLMTSSAFQTLMIVIAVWSICSTKTIYLMYHTLGRDFRGAMIVLKLLRLVKSAEYSNTTVPKMFAKTVAKTPDKIMIAFEDEKWTFKMVEDYSNKVANYFSAQGFKKGDSVALFMENRPEYVCLWLGLSKIGVIVALVNTNLRQESLIHSARVANAKAIIYGTELASAVEEVWPNLKNGSLSYPAYSSGGQPKEDSKFPSKHLDFELKNADTSPVAKEIQDSIGFKDKMLYIYTSGTTGLPKAAVIKHSRFIIASGGFEYVFGVRLDDVVYSPLPLYHSVAGMVGMSGSMRCGITLVIKKKFSASSFWKDCVKHNVTAAQYIGELCRYLLSTPECPEEKQHKVRLVFGNGLRPQIWGEFVKRFGIQDVAEFYGSTEGNTQIINNENRLGAIGFISVLVPSILPMVLVKVDEETREVIRDPDSGLCVPCQPGEPGEFLGKIVTGDPAREFHGYVDSSASSKKVLRDVRSKGDIWFRSGDVLEMDEFGWLYFKDRTGDTFRWKGENVSTTEVEAVLSGLVGLQDAIVYGVEVPNTDGKAGMAAIHDPDFTVDLEKLAEGIKAKLPPYARPLFLRLIRAKELDRTGTFKLKKFRYQKEGYCPKFTQDDKLYLLNKEGNYSEIDDKVYSELSSGSMRL